MVTPGDEIARLSREIRELRWAVQSYRVGTVAATSPLEVLLDGDTVSTPMAVRNSAYSPAEGDRVRVVPWGNRLAVEAKYEDAT